MSNSKKALRLSLRVSPETVSEYVPFVTDEGAVLTYPSLSLFYKYDASNLGLIDYNKKAHSLEFLVPTAELVIPLDDKVRESIERIGEGIYIYDLDRKLPIWDIVEGYPLDFEDWRYIPVSEVQSALICSYDGFSIKVDPHGYHQELAYFKSKLDRFSGTEPTVYGIMLLSKLILGRRGVDIPVGLIQNYLPLFIPGGSPKDQFIKPKQLISAVNIAADMGIRDDTPDLKEIVGEELEDDEELDVSVMDVINNELEEEFDDLYDGTRCLSTIIKLPPDKWTSHPQERLRIKQDIVISGKISKIICRGTNLIFHTPDAKLSPSSLVKQLGMPTEITGNVLVIVG